MLFPDGGLGRARPRLDHAATIPPSGATGRKARDEAVNRIDEPAFSRLKGRMRDNAEGPWWKKLAWFAGLWAAGVLAVGAVSYALRWWLHP